MSFDRGRVLPSLLWATVCSLGVFTGCSKPEVGIVAGRVTLDNQPLTNASVVFEDASRGISVSVPLAEDGTFHAQTYDQPGLPPGNYRVAIRPGTIGSGEAPLVGDADPNQPAPISSVPERYRSVKTSELSINVELGENLLYEFALSSAPD